MVDLKILRLHGSTNERLREVLTATTEKIPPQKGESKEERKARIQVNRDRERNFLFRQKIEALVQSRVISGIEYSLRNYKPYAAVDLAYDSILLTKIHMPLMLYAQGKIDVQRAATLLQNLKNGDAYIQREKETNRAVGINLPKFIESEVNVVRSMVNRRWAAQKNKYSNLWPYFYYEPRSTGMVGKLRADVMSQRADIMVDQFGTRHQNAQVMLDGLLYGHVVNFTRASWEVEKQIRFDAAGEQETYVAREGVGFVRAHPTRTFWDLSHPLASLNSDSGCEYVGFWDVVRYGAVENDPAYFNRDRIGFGTNLWGGNGLYRQYIDYFNQYNYAINIPQGAETNTLPGGQSIDLAGANDAKNFTGLYSTINRDSAMFVTNYYHKLVPKEWGLGNYPYPVWVRFVFASDSVPIYAEFMPSRPCAVLSVNENDSRAVSPSMAMDVMQYQQQMSNLLTHLMKLLQIEAFKAIGINLDAFQDAKEVDALVKALRAEDWYADPVVFKYSVVKKMQELGITGAKGMTEVINISEARQSQSINTVFDAMVKLLSLAERMQGMSAAEAGQSEPREISATQTNVIANTTQSIHSSISDAVDDFREAEKIIIYESTISCSTAPIECPVKGRYTERTVAAAGFTLRKSEDEDFVGDAKRRTVIGSSKALIHNFIFSSRDGSERPVNTQAANTIVQLLQQLLTVPIVVQALGKEKLFNIFNEVFRLSGAGLDLNLELAEGEDNSIGQDEMAEIKGSVDELVAMLQQLAKQTQKNAEDISGQAQVNADQQEAIDMSAQLAQQVLKLQQTVQDILSARENTIKPPEIRYADAPPSVQAQIERANRFTPAPASERRMNQKPAVKKPADAQA